MARNAISGQEQQEQEDECKSRATGERLWTDADYYYEDHVDNVWSIIISVLLNEGEEGGRGVLQQLQPRKVCSIHLRTLSQCERGSEGSQERYRQTEGRNERPFLTRRSQEKRQRDGTS